MLVRYVGPERHPHLSGQEEYVVLAISGQAGSRDQPLLMLHEPDRSGAFDWAFWPLDLFEIVSAEIPSNWIVHNHPRGGLDLMPAAWCRPWHWDDLDPSTSDTRPRDVLAAAVRRAWADYHGERDRILAEAGRPPGNHALPGPSCSLPPARPGGESQSSGSL